MARFIRTCRGQSVTETALILPLFLMVCFGIIDLGRLFYTHMTLQHAMRQAGRFAATGNRMEDPDHPGTDLSRVNSIILVARQAAAGIDVSNIQISSAQGGSSGPGRAGGPGDTVTISLTTTMRLLTPLIGRFFGQTQSYPIEVQATFRNEPFPPNQTSW